MGKDQELIEAARNGDYAVVEKILNSRAKKGPLASLRRGPGANAQDANGFSALHHAAVNRHKNIVELLLSHEASTNIVDLQGSSPLHLAAWSGNEEIVRLLLTQGPSVPGPGPNVNLMNKSSETPLHMASQFGHTEVVKLLLHHGADSVITNEKQETALDLAAQYGRLETVQLLLKSHPELLALYQVPVSSNRQQILFPHTPLHLASRNGHRSVVEVLVKSGFEVNARTSQGTALHEAALCGKVDVVKTLLDASVDVCVADSQRRTAVDRLNEVGLKTPVAKEIAELIRNALKKKLIQQGKASSPLCSPHESVPNSLNNKDGKLPLSQIYDNHSYSDVESKLLRYSPNHSPKTNSFARGKTRRSMDVSMGKGPDFEKPVAPPKKPPRRNLSASPTHPGMPDFASDHPDLVLISRNKSLDEGVYGDRWRKSLTTYDTSQSTESIDLSPIENSKSNSSAKGDMAFFNGLDPDDLKTKSKSQHGGLDSKYVSVAHIRLRDAKSEQNVSPLGLTQGESSDDLDGSNDEPHNEKIVLSPPPQGQRKSAINKPPNVVDVHTKNYKNNEGIVMIVDVDQRKRTLPRGPKPAIAPKPVIPPKPKNIKRQGHSCENVLDENESKAKAASGRKSTPKSTSMSVLSPVDVDKEWEHITMFMDSFNSKEVGAESGEMKNLFCMSPMGRWLTTIKLTDYEQLLIASGFDDLAFLGEGIMDEISLLEIGVLNAQHRKIMAASAIKLEVSWPRSIRSDEMPLSVEQWLKDLRLDRYIDNFKKNMYTDPDRLLRLFNDELITLLEIDLVGHRRRILVASSKINKIQHKVNSSSTNSTRFENGVAIDQIEDDGSLPLRDPNHLVSGVSSALKTAWRHAPETLIDGSVTYKAVYVGSSKVQEFSTTDSIQLAIQEIRNKEIGDRPNVIPSGALLLNTQVTLIVSATVISWYNAKTKSLVKEQDIRSIQCTCQASDDLRHLALVTRASDPNDKSHSCHVFCLDSVEVATEAILTLGQAFEVAYQLALVSQTQGRDNKGHMRSKSANQLSSKTTYSPNSKLKREKGFSNMTANNHYRSQSVNDIPPPPVMHGVSKSSSNSPQIDPHFKSDYYKIPRAESFNFSSNSHLARAPIVSKEEL